MSRISEEEFVSRINNPSNLLNIFEVDKKNEPIEINEKDIESFIKDGYIVNSHEVRHTGIQGKVEGDRNIHPIMRDIITMEGNFNGVSKTANQWGVSPASVSNFKNGIPDRRPGHELSERNTRAQEILEGNVGKIRKVVEKKILKTLELLTSEALETQDAKSLSVIARNLSLVVSSVEKKDINVGQTVNVQTIFYAPEPASVKDYEVIPG